MDERILHFSLSPVQTFVAQARRTRDFWSGSFILSYLAGQAMLAVYEAHGRLILPAVTDGNKEITNPLFSAIRKRAEGVDLHDGPSVATLPNRFQAEITDEFDPEVCVNAVQKSWESLAEAVWRRFVEPVAYLGKDTAEIWKRQIKKFWEINWVVGNDGSLLDRRKNWRTYVPPSEPGDKCTLMGDLQELSGYIRTHERKQQREFWRAMRREVQTFDLDEDERLCAVALVKRLFPRITQEAIGWQLPPHYPSTPYLSSVHWVEQMIKTKPERAQQYAVSARRLRGIAGKERPDRFECLRQVLARHSAAEQFASLEGHSYFTAALENPRQFRQWVDGVENDALVRQELVQELRQLGNPPSPFYALLLMDGDHIGALLQTGHGNEISRALLAFSRDVQRVVDKYNGITVYSGGDDVFALFPLEDALPAAQKLRRSYTNCFAGTGKGTGQGTISAAVVYAHYAAPLASVIGQAHHLLDDVAKSECGRDSLAVMIWNNTGPSLTWAAPWAVIEDETGNILEDLVNGFRGENNQDREYNSSFFYNLRTRFAIFDQEEGHLLSDEDVVDLLSAEYLKNRERNCSMSDVRRRMKNLLRVCRRSWRDDAGLVHTAEGCFNLNGALIVRFLTQKGVEW